MSEAIRGDHWKPSLPPEDRAAYDAAWQAKTSCRWCKWWLYDEEDNDGVGVCGGPSRDHVAGSLAAPEDYTCSEFERQSEP